MPVIKNLTKQKRIALISLIAFAILIIAPPLGISSAAYRNQLTSPSSRQIQPTSPKQVTLVVAGGKTVMLPSKIDQAKITQRVSKIAEATQRPATSAKIINKKGAYVIVPSAAGQQVDVALAVKMIKSGLFAGQTTVSLPYKPVEPKVTEVSLGPELRKLKAEQAAQIAARVAQARQQHATLTSVHTAVVSGPCAGNPAGHKLVLVSISRQHMWGCNGVNQIYSTAITSGAYLAGRATPTGTWHIYSKSRNLYLTGPGYRYFVKYWIPFYSDYGFHDSSWQTFPYGSSRYASDGSHGCVHLPAAAATWMYSWAPIGTTVTIRG